MEKFWAVILIFVVVAAAGLMYVNQVYNPQKDSQIAMADTANQTLSAVKSDVEDTAPTTVNAANVIQTVTMYCKEGNTVDIIVNEKTYEEDSDDIITEVGDLDNYYTKVVKKEESTGVILRIEFKRIDT
jgi:hypothetical protein